MATIQFLDEPKWAFIGLDVMTRFSLAAEIDRLGDVHRAGTARRLSGTRHVYRAHCGGRVIVYHERGGRITILLIR
jgi:hypothetical protein